jgi:hypothetical protein
MKDSGNLLPVKFFPVNSNSICIPALGLKKLLIKMKINVD